MLYVYNAKTQIKYHNCRSTVGVLKNFFILKTNSFCESKICTKFDLRDNLMSRIFLSCV